ncbi:helix-turn-helix domain-containing protein [Robertmurraya korlensis]|uniref:CdaR family transcriptional regulator n=1 Tax=Robertmurraya korlensis TaxID=519977 RepID=UPI00203F52CE|nr:sugar diacid recognition domain-containing protein [Robertmurraya korlensis]MCM3601223.1 helix-turn-helix domain-containing protein [Robertmurraya korlensis]
MQIYEKLAQDLVEEVSKLINEQVIVTDTNGMIVASTDPSRISSFHEGAMLAIIEKKTLFMDEEKVNTLQGVRYGIVLPLFIHGKSIGCIGITGKPEVVAPYAQLLKKLTELFIQDNAFREELERRERELELFVFDWLHAKHMDQQLMDRANFFHIDLSAFHQVIIFKTINEPFHLSYSQINVVKQQWSGKEQTLLVRWGREKLLVFLPSRNKPITREEIERLRKVLLEYTNGEVVVGVGQYGNPEKIQNSYQQAERASVVASKKRGIIFEEDLKFDILQFALSEETKQEFIERTIHAIMDDEVLIQTLDAWFACNLSNKETASLLHIHINTLNYRLNKISDLTHFNLKNTDQLVMLYLAYRFLLEYTKNSHN